MKFAPWLAPALVACIENDFSAPAEADPAPTSTPAATTPEPGSPGDPVSEDPPAVLPCDEVETLSVALAFPARQDCPWGIDDNLAQADELNRARVEEVHDIVLPDGAQLCDLAIHSRSADLVFDDHVTITLDDVVLVGGGYGYAIEELAVVANLPRYRWVDIAGIPFRGRDEPYYCIGEPDSACVLPITEQGGPLDVELSEAATDDLIDAMVGHTTLPFRLITFGDNDEDDCAHTDLTLDVSVTYTLP